MVEDSMSRELAPVEDLDLFSTAFTSAAIGMALVAPDGRFLNVNDAMCEITGYRRAELLRRDFQSITHPGDLDKDVAYARQLLEGERKVYQMEKRYVRKDGSVIWVLLSGSLVRHATGEPRFFIAQVQDIAARKKAEAELTSFFALSTDPLATASSDGLLQRVNGAWTKVLGWELGELEGRSIASLLHPEDVERTAQEFGRIAAAGRADTRWVNRYRHKNGTYRWLEWTTSIGPDGTFIGMARDVTDRLQNESRLARRNQRLTRALSDLKRAHEELQVARERLERLAHYDTLTGVGNRNLFLKEMDRVAEAAIRDDRTVALLMIDLDGFKEVNDTLGHSAGDAVLQEFALRLKEVLHHADRLFRLGGDEFAVLHMSRGKNSERDAVALAERIVGCLDAPMRVKGDDFIVRASVGIAVLPGHADTASTLIRKADAAMYEVKRSNGGAKIQLASDLEATTVLKKLQPKPRKR